MSAAIHNSPVSVLLPVFNARPYLRDALESLAAQTFTDFEVIAVDDGSTDGSGMELVEAARTWPWLRIFRQEQGGVAKALNRAWGESRGAFVARMDADDRAHPLRIERQFEFLNRNPDVGICGTAARTFGVGAAQLIRPPIDDQDIRARLVFGCAFAHPTVMFRRAAFASIESLYEDHANEGAQDYDLWVRSANRMRMHNLSEVLLDYRMHARQVTARRGGTRLARVRRIWLGLLGRLGIDPTNEDIRAHEACAAEDMVDGEVPTGRIEAWLHRLNREVPLRGWCSANAFGRECREAWWRAALRRRASCGSAWAFAQSPFGGPRIRRFWRAARLVRRGLRDT